MTMSCKIEILRPDFIGTQNDIMTQSFVGEGKGEGKVMV